MIVRHAGSFVQMKEEKVRQSRNNRSNTNSLTGLRPAKSFFSNLPADHRTCAPIHRMSALTSAERKGFAITMLFCTVQYVIFLGVILAVYWSMPWAKARIWLLLGASFFFYASWNKWLALLIGVTTVADFLIALGIESASTVKRKKLLLWFSSLMNLGILFIFKYANFFLDSLRESLEHFGAQASIPLLSVILPIGISFYTFEAISYIVDVYRGRMKAEKNLSHFMLFILFFPHLVAGPIVRGRDFLPQINRPKRWNWSRASLGFWLIILGTFKKLAIADRLALYVDPVFASPDLYSAGALWMAAIAFTIQLFCDFSGYSDIALGSAHLLGYKLVVNFRLPFLAANIAEFWRRWHISLSSWLRDYLFFSLGGSRGWRWLTYRNLLIVMTIGGLWHGAAWNFVVWGAVVGTLLVTHRIFAEICGRVGPLNGLLRTRSGIVFRVTFTFVSCVLTFVIFRAPSLSTAGAFFHRLLCLSDGVDLPFPIAGLWWTFAVVACGHAFGWWIMNHRLSVWRWTARIPAPTLGFATAAVLNIALIVNPAVSKAFIYFQF